MAVAGLILAAGGSSRMKTAKQLLPWGSNSLLQHVIQTAKRAKLDRLYLVLGAEASEIAQQLDLEGISVVHNEQWKDGLGSSLAKGVSAIAVEASIEACLVLLADQPFITAEYLNAMVHAADPETIIASDYQGKAGVPCLFPRHFFPELQSLKGDQGAGKLLHALSSHVQVLQLPADLTDIDTPEAYRKHHPG